MTSAEKLATFRADIGDIICQDDAKALAVKSKDYYWYSPILKDLLDDKLAQLIVVPPYDPTGGRMRS